MSAATATATVSPDTTTGSRFRRHEPDQTSDDLAHGQIVIVTARWILVVLGLLLSLYRATDLFALQVSIGVILTLAVANFFLTARILRRLPVQPELVYAASAADILLISIIIAIGSGYESNVFVYYFPAVLAFALVFPPVVTASFAAGTVLLYAAISASVWPGIADSQIMMARLLSLVTVAVVAFVSWRREGQHRRSLQSAATNGMGSVRSRDGFDTAHEKKEDIWHGQVASIWARWGLIGTGLLLTLWGASDIRELQLKVVLFLPILVLNFFMHGRHLMDSPLNRTAVYAASLVDLVVITLMIATAWGGSAGLANPFFIFYYPVVLAFALVFSPRITLPFAVGVVAVYGAISVVTGVDLGNRDEVTLLSRLVTLLATAGLGTMYWRIQRRRRAATLERLAAEVVSSPSSPTGG